MLATLITSWISWHWKKGHLLSEWRNRSLESLPITYKLGQKQDLKQTNQSSTFA